jgi:hypothetical protein
MALPSIYGDAINEWCRAPLVLPQGLQIVSHPANHAAAIRLGVWYSRAVFLAREMRADGPGLLRNIGMK